MTWDAIVIGSGFGGAMAAYGLVDRGHRVLMLERGGWVARGPDNWGSQGAAYVSSHFSMDAPYQVDTGLFRTQSGAVHCVGGQSVFYGGASLRFRERDFMHAPQIVGDSDAAWPISYRDLEPAYAEAERLLGVAGQAGVDPTEPFRSTPFTGALGPLSAPAQAITDAARRLGLRPFPIPLAIAFEAQTRRGSCMRCGTCDGYACATEAKNDVATRMIPALVARGMTLRANVVCVRLVRRGARVTGVEFEDRVTGERGTLQAHTVVLAAGTLATPHLLLASGFDRINPAGDTVGRYLTRHSNAVTFGVFRHAPNPDRVFDKQVAIHDFYHGIDHPDAPAGPLGSLQQLTPPVGLARAYLPAIMRGPASMFLSRASGLLAMAEDQPQRDNRVFLDTRARDRFGLPRLQVRHRYSARDRAATRVLVQHARAVMREAGAFATWTHAIGTFSHALGTVRMGDDEETAPLDAHGRFRGLDNLFVTDGSALPRSAAVNPSLTIAANALRIGWQIANTMQPVRAVRRRLPIFA
ncbi:MAG: GMC family oxidoreductase [Gemmatimonadota bacterium]